MREADASDGVSTAHLYHIIYPRAERRDSRSRLRRSATCTQFAAPEGTPRRGRRRPLRPPIKALSANQR